MSASIKSVLLWALFDSIFFFVTEEEYLAPIRSMLPSPHGTFAHPSPVILSSLGNLTLWIARPYFRVALSAALTYEDTHVGRRDKKGLECWSLARLMNACRQMGKSMVDYATLPIMQTGRRPTGWDAWGLVRHWVLLHIAEKDLLKDIRIWHLPRTNGHTFIAVLLRYYDEPYYFPHVGSLLKALQRNAQGEDVIVSQPGLDE